MRAFIAIDLPPSIREVCSQVQKNFQNTPTFDGKVRWVTPANLHITLKFLGEMQKDRQPAIEEGLVEIATKSPCFDLSLGEPGALPNSRKPRVLYIGLQDAGALQTLFRCIDSAMSTLGFEKENRVFTPHLTLGRIKSAPRKVPWDETFDRLRLLPDYHFRVHSFHLMQSKLTPEGAHYRSLREFPLTSETR